MKKGQLTREMILAKAAALFNTEGYTRASLSSIMDATGLEKGGIYNHFGSKDQLMLEAFDYAIKQTGGRIKQLVDEQSVASGKLFALVEYFTSVLSENPPVPGGCPVMNTAIECDDSMPELKQRAQTAMTRFLKFTEDIIRAGIECGEFKSSVNPAESAQFLIGSLEGGLMLSKLLGKNAKTKSLSVFWENEINSWKGDSNEN